MSTLAQLDLADVADSATATTPRTEDSYFEQAAVLEARLRDAELRIESLTGELRAEQVRRAYTRSWIVALRRSHRKYSHAVTGKVFRYALDLLSRLDAIPDLGSKTIRTPASLLDSIVVVDPRSQAAVTRRG